MPLKGFACITISKEYYDKAKKLAEKDHRPVANYIEILIDKDAQRSRS